MDRSPTVRLSPAEIQQNSTSEPILPDFGGSCISEITPTLLGRADQRANESPFVSDEVLGARQVVLLVLDGLGWMQFLANQQVMPNLSAMTGCPITSVLPTTTATALTSITTGRSPSEHGVVGYRIAQQDNVLNILKWTTPIGDARKSIPPHSLQPIDPFLGTKPPVISRAEFEGTGFTDAHLAGSPLRGWRMPSAIPVEIGHVTKEGAPFVYVYYDGIDKTAHDKGLGEYYVAELRATDRLIGDISATLPKGTALCVTADHGQVEVHSPPIMFDDDVMANVAMLSGEGRFRWLHARNGASPDLLAVCAERYSDVGWVYSRSEIIEAGWLGGTPKPEVMSRLGDVALVARDAVAFFDPHDTGELRLVSRHGSATADEMYVPFITYVA